MIDSDVSLLEKVDAALNGNSQADALSQVLNLLLEQFDCPTGTVHLLDEKSGALKLTVHRGIPDVVLDKIQLIPLGKGMAGIAAERREPVQVCNLQTDNSGLARPAAKETRMEGAIAVPILEGEHLRGTLGIGKTVPYEFSAAESELLMQAAAK